MYPFTINTSNICKYFIEKKIFPPDNILQIEEWLEHKIEILFDSRKGDEGVSRVILFALSDISKEDRIVLPGKTITLDETTFSIFVAHLIVSIEKLLGIKSLPSNGL
jgi:hypothetical protein